MMELRERVARAILRGYSRASVACGASAQETTWEETPPYGQQRYLAIADAAIAEVRKHDLEEPAGRATVTRDGPVTAIHDPTLPVDGAGILDVLRSWGAARPCKPDSTTEGT